jgi:competence protein ComEA
LKQIQKYISDYLKISIQEARGAVLVFVLLILGFLANRFYSAYSLGKTSDIVIKEYGNVNLPEQDEPKFWNNNKFADNKFQKNYYSDKAVERFNFNPNEASDTDLKRLGFPPFLAKIIVNYRSKGGKFKYKEDLLRIYGMKPELYSSIFPLLTLPSKTESSQQKDYQEDKLIAEAGAKPSYSTAVTKSYENAAPFKKKDIPAFDINIADTTQMMALAGIGKGYANRILKFRDGLGGFHSIDQVAETFGLPAEVMPEIKKKCFVGDSFKKIYINKTDFIKHTYVKYAISKVIVNYRKQHGPFKNVEDLKNVIILDAETIQKIRPYLDFSLP